MALQTSCWCDARTPVDFRDVLQLDPASLASCFCVFFLLSGLLCHHVFHSLHHIISTRHKHKKCFGLKALRVSVAIYPLYSTKDHLLQWASLFNICSLLYILLQSLLFSLSLCALISSPTHRESISRRHLQAGNAGVRIFQYGTKCPDGSP